MTTPYIGTFNTWHEEIDRIEDGDVPTGDIASAPDRQNKDNANYLYSRMITSTHRATSVEGAGSWTPTIGENQKILAVLVRVCGGGESGANGVVDSGAHGGQGAGYSERYITGTDLQIPATITYYVGAGGAGAANSGQNGISNDGEHTWVDLGDYGAVIGRGGGGTAGSIITTTNHVIVRPIEDIDNYPPHLGWGRVAYGDGSEGTGDTGRSGHLPGGAGGSSGGGVGRAGKGYGAGGGGGRNASGSAGGGGGGGGGWFEIAGAANEAQNASDNEGGRGATGRVEITIWFELAT